MQRILPTEPRKVAAAARDIIENRPLLYEPRDWIRVGPDVFTAADMRDEADHGESGVDAGLAGWVAILTAPDTAELDDQRDGWDEFFMPGTDSVSIFDLAREALHLGKEDAAWLLDTGREVPELITALGSLADGKPMQRS